MLYTWVLKWGLLKTMQILTKCPSHYASAGHGRMQLGTGRVSPLQQPRTASHLYVFESGSGAIGFGLCGLPATADMHTSQSNAAGPLRWGRPGRTVRRWHQCSRQQRRLPPLVEAGWQQVASRGWQLYECAGATPSWYFHLARETRCVPRDVHGCRR